jgi:hypothetical protein
METGCYTQLVSTLLAKYSSQQDLQEHIILITCITFCLSTETISISVIFNHMCFFI